MLKLNAKEKMLNFLTKKSGVNTFTTTYGRRLFGVKNIAARIYDLRQDGYAIRLNTNRHGNRVYQLEHKKSVGTTTKSVA
jgi:hypothetical protein